MAISRIVLLLFVGIAFLWTTTRADLVISKLDRKIDVTKQVVRVTSSFKVENAGPSVESKVLLAFPTHQAKNMAELLASPKNLRVDLVKPQGMPPDLTFYAVQLPKDLSVGETLSFDVLAVFTNSLQPFPEQITQTEAQLVVFQDSAYFLSPYAVKAQSLLIKLPNRNVESFTKLENSKLTDSEIRYGPFENLPSFSYKPIVVHFECKGPFAVAQQLHREIEISHWGNVQVTEHYKLVHAGALNRGGFSRFDYQSRPYASESSSFRHLIARLPPRAHSVYYRDEIGNISTSHLWGNSRKTELVIEPRYPMFGGWRTSFTIGYGLPLKDFLFQSEGRRLLNISFGCPIEDVVVEDLTVKVVLPEGSYDFSSFVPFSAEKRQEVKQSHLDIEGRPVIVLKKSNVVPEHNRPLLVSYRFNNLSLLREPLMLVSGFFLLFITYVALTRIDMSISKSSASYIAQLQWDEVQTTVQRVLGLMNRSLTAHAKLEHSLRDLSHTGDIQSCKAARKVADGVLKELLKELKLASVSLQSSPQAAHICPKVEEMIAKEREIQERLMLKHSAVVDSFEKKHSGREIESRVAVHEQKLATLKHEVAKILEFLDEVC
ncbi:ribophorin I isoform X2 [Wolffia australiana]